MNKNSIYNNSMYQMRIINKRKSWMRIPNLNILMTKYNNKIADMQLFKLQLNSIQHKLISYKKVTLTKLRKLRNRNRNRENIPKMKVRIFYSKK